MHIIIYAYVHHLYMYMYSEFGGTYSMQFYDEIFLYCHSKGMNVCMCADF